MIDANYYSQVNSFIVKGVKNDVMELELVSGKKIICSLVQKFVTNQGVLHLYQAINRRAAIATVDGYEQMKTNICLPSRRMIEVDVSLPIYVNGIAIA